MGDAWNRTTLTLEETQEPRKHLSRSAFNTPTNFRVNWLADHAKLSDCSTVGRLACLPPPRTKLPSRSQLYRPNYLPVFTLDGIRQLPRHPIS